MGQRRDSQVDQNRAVNAHAARFTYFLQLRMFTASYLGRSEKEFSDAIDCLLEAFKSETMQSMASVVKTVDGRQFDTERIRIETRENVIVFGEQAKAYMLSLFRAMRPGDKA